MQEKVKDKSQAGAARRASEINSQLLAQADSNTLSLYFSSPLALSVIDLLLGVLVVVVAIHLII